MQTVKANAAENYRTVRFAL